MAKKSKQNFVGQKNLWEQTLPETANQAPAPTVIKTHVSASCLGTVVCPKCGAPGAQSMRGGEYSGMWYCTGGCSYGDNFYFTPAP